jgi:predicted nicotinamide N-methyase
MPAALKAAIELDVFTHIGSGQRTADNLARKVGASGRGVRILCDYLVIGGFLTKEGNEYSLSPDAAVFLDRNSPAYLGSVTRFLLDPRLIAPYLDLAQVVRNGRTSLPDQGTVSHDNPIWVEFAREMAALLRPVAAEISELVAGDRKIRVLDIAAGHGLFGISIAQHNANAQITAVDWPNVLAVASENAAKAGVADRHSLIAGDAFEVEFGGPYDLVLVTNFFHHFDPSVCEKLMRKIVKSLAADGRCLTLDFVPNADRVSPPSAAGFAMMMLGTTVSGDAYTFDEYDAMFRRAGFASSELLPLTRSAESLIISRKS